MKVPRYPVTVIGKSPYYGAPLARNFGIPHPKDVPPPLEASGFLETCNLLRASWIGPKEHLMFSFLLSFPKKVLSTVLILGFLAAVIGCASNITDDNSNIPGTLPERLQGEWVFIPPGSSKPADYYVIKEATVEYVFDDPEWGSFGYEGDIRFVSNYSSSSGVIIIEYTNDSSDPAKPFAGIYYKNLTNSTVQLANAINTDYSSADTATLKEAIDKFIRNKMDTYVSWAYVQPYTKKNAH